MTPKELQAARDMLMEMAVIAKKYNKPFFAVTEGASITRNNGSAAVRNAREAQIEWEKHNGGDPDEDWGARIMPSKEANIIGQYTHSRVVEKDMLMQELMDLMKPYLSKTASAVDKAKERAYYKELYKKILEKYPKYAKMIKINPKLPVGGYAHWTLDKPVIILKEEDPIVLAHEIGHFKAKNSFRQWLSGLLWDTGYNLKWRTPYRWGRYLQESAANHRALKVLKSVGYPDHALKKLKEGAYSAYEKALLNDDPCVNQDNGDLTKYAK